MSDGKARSPFSCVAFQRWEHDEGFAGLGRGKTALNEMDFTDDPLLQDLLDSLDFQVESVVDKAQPVEGKGDVEHEML